MLNRYDNLNGNALQRLVRGGTELVPYSRSILKAAEEAAFQLYSDIASTDRDFRQLFEQWQRFRQEIYAWHKVNEFSFASYSYQSQKGAK